MTLKQKIEQIQSGKLTAVKNLTNFSKEIATQKTKELNIFLHLNENAIEQAKEIDKRVGEKKKVGKLAGLCFAVKSNISVQGLTTNCASKVLEDYVSAYNTTVINKLQAEDAIILGMVNMDEFACGGSGETSAFGPTKNPTDPKKVPGGTSSGSAAAVAANLCDFALGTDTGGSIRNPASHCKITGLRPTYGAVSRYGLIDMTMSFDCIGPLTKTAEDAKLIFDVIKGTDNFDQTTQDAPKKEGKEKKVLGLVDVQEFTSKKISQRIEEQAQKIAEKNNYKLKKIKLPLDIALETYYIIVYTEFFSATRKFDGRRFGKKIEDVAGPEVIRRIIGGSEITKAEHEGKFYREAKKAQDFIKAEFKKIFASVDAIILPTVPRGPHNIGEEISVEDMYAYDVFTTPASIAGIPAISVPIPDCDSGLQIMGPEFSEELLFELAKEFS